MIYFSTVSEGMKGLSFRKGVQLGEKNSSNNSICLFSKYGVIVKNHPQDF